MSASPIDVKQVVGYALFLAQIGGKHDDASPLKGLKGGGVLAVTIDHDGNTWRLAYTLAMPKEIWVLHFFQKKAKRGIANPKRDMDLIERRFKELMALRRRKHIDR